MKTIEIRCYGTKAKQAEAVKLGKDPNEVFLAQVPDFDLVASDPEAYGDIVAQFMTCYGYSDPAKFWNKCLKHLCDKLRSEHHRPQSDDMMTLKFTKIATIDQLIAWKALKGVEAKAYMASVINGTTTGENDDSES